MFNNYWPPLDIQWIIGMENTVHIDNACIVCVFVRLTKLCVISWMLNFSVLRSIIGHQTACFRYLCPVWYQCSSLSASDRWAVSWSLNADMISSIRHLWRACQHNKDRCCGTLCSLIKHRRQSCFHCFEPQTECIIVILFWSNIHYNRRVYGQIFNL